jgi:ATP-binding cassette subfamily F protein uup
VLRHGTEDKVFRAAVCQPARLAWCWYSLKAMPPIINAQQISKTYGITPLFHNISFTVSEGDRIGLIGPNGIGKSTLLKILANRLAPDSGDVAVRKRTRLSYVAQQSEFDATQTVQSVVEAAMDRTGVAESERQSLMAETLGRAGFEDFQAEAASLSGGWRKRLTIVEGLVESPDVLLLDEPTNHLDLAGIKWLEGVLETGKFACVTVSHDRYLLENVSTELVELNRVYEGGLLRQGKLQQFSTGQRRLPSGSGQATRVAREPRS